MAMILDLIGDSSCLRFILINLSSPKNVYSKKLVCQQISNLIVICASSDVDQMHRYNLLKATTHGTAQHAVGQTDSP